MSHEEEAEIYEISGARGSKKAILKTREYVYSNSAQDAEIIIKFIENHVPIETRNSVVAHFSSGVDIHRIEDTLARLDREEVKLTNYLRINRNDNQALQKLEDIVRQKIKLKEVLETVRGG